MSSDHLSKQLEFIVETDKLKSVERRTKPIGTSRRENSAEHSWQVALSAMLWAEHADSEIDLLRVIKMLLIHDVVEVDVGDTFHYDKESVTDLEEREEQAAQRLYGMLPEKQGQEFLELWREFEARQSPDARFAAAVDRIMAFIMNARNEGGTWSEYQLRARDVLDKNSHISAGSQQLWELANSLVSSGVERGFLKGEESN